MMGFLRLYQESVGQQNGQASPQPSNSPPRSFTSRPFFSPKRVFRSQSSQNLRKAAGSATAQVTNSQTTLNNSTPDLNTLADPRNSNDAPMSTTSTSSEPNQHPDLSNEVAALSTKLINAINHQTTLDDSLQSTRHELEAARSRAVQLEAALKEHKELVSTGVLVKRVDAERTADGLRGELTEERTLRFNAEKQRKGMEMELENLTSSLFEEANTMVAEARRNNAHADRRNEQLKIQLQDSEVLLASHQQQLRDLKAVLEQIQQERDQEDRMQASSAPHTPMTPFLDNGLRIQEMRRDSRPVLALIPVSPEPPLRFSNLIRPMLRLDLAAYDEFVTILRTGVRTSPHSRVSSGSMGGLNVMGLGASTNSAQFMITPPLPPTNVPLASVANNSPLSSPSLPGSFNSGSPSDSASTTTLEKSKFYKRILTEDIEPTLRLDSAPGLSWLVRRSVVSSMVSGLLVIEPWPPGSRFHSPAFPCALCGEQRKDDIYVRRHRFRTTDSDDAQRYPLCEYCLERVRATCELVGFLKLLKNGQWRADGAEEARLAWEDCVRLRERMFWARMGGGVVPVAPKDDIVTPVVATQVSTAPIPEEEESGSRREQEDAMVEASEVASPTLPPRPTKQDVSGDASEETGDQPPVLPSRPSTAPEPSELDVAQPSPSNPEPTNATSTTSEPVEPPSTLTTVESTSSSTSLGANMPGSFS